ncbi:MAG: gene transfer agent family protein [Pseudomonadota bacterium]
MTNPWRGDVAIVLGRKRYVMRLTLGALAALEAELDVPSLVALVERFEGSRFSTRDVLALLKAGLSGGGHTLTDAEIAAADIDGGPMAAARAAAELLARAFMVPEG